ncbi:hypothetical protein F9K50_01270 [bacterium]|nr:MAG: hypothetical protein F9K50_01270 [bacterium]
MIPLDWFGILKIIGLIVAAGGVLVGVRRALKYGQVKDELKNAVGRERILQDALLKQGERERNHEKRLEKILNGNIGAADVGRMLSDYPAENRETQRSKAPPR